MQVDISEYATKDEAACGCVQITFNAVVGHGAHGDPMYRCSPRGGLAANGQILGSYGVDYTEDKRRLYQCELHKNPPFRDRK